MSVGDLVDLAGGTCARAEWVSLFLGVVGVYWLALGFGGLRLGRTRGFGWRAQESEVRVVKAKTGEWIYADQVEKLNPGDAIWVPEEPPATDFWAVFNTTLQVLAQVAAIVAATAAIIIATR